MHYTIILFLCFLFGRISLLCSRYFLETASGGYLVIDWIRFLPFQLVADIGVFALVSLIFTLFRSYKIAACILTFYMLAMGLDDECVRWMGSRFSLQFIYVYVLNTQTDFSLVSKIFMDGIAHFCLTIGIIIATTVTFLYLTNKLAVKNIESKHKNILIGIFLMLAIAGLTSVKWWNPSKSRLVMIRPIGIHWLYEIFENLKPVAKPENYEKGIQLLGGNPQNEYPFWFAANDSVAYSDFKKQEKPDIIILAIESMRAKYSDIRDSVNCSNLPNICEFSKQAMFFPDAHSVGFPTVEGIAGIQMGIYSHPKKQVIRSRKHYLKSLTLPDILGQAGYYKAVFTASEPHFDNLMPHFNDWFDYVEYDPNNNEDISLANKTAQWLMEQPKDKPLYLTYMNTTTHTPFTLPKKSGYPTPENLQERYKMALHYADSAIGILLNTIKTRDRESIIIILGDHSMPEDLTKAINNIDKNYTNIPIFISASSLPKDSVDLRTVSQSSVAPTILDILKLNVSNHFISKSLLDSSHSPVFAFRDNNWFVYNTELNSSLEKSAMEAWSYILDKDLLMP